MPLHLPHLSVTAGEGRNTEGYGEGLRVGSLDELLFLQYLFRRERPSG